MKNYLAIFLGSPEGMDKWKQMPEVDRKPKEQEGMMAWGKWATDNEKSIVNPGAPLGKTKRVGKDGIKDVRNELGGMGCGSG